MEQNNPYREIFENNLRRINDSKNVNDLILLWFDQSVDEIVNEKDKQIEELKCYVNTVKMPIVEKYEQLEQELQRLRVQKNESFSILKGVLEEYHINPFHAEQIKQLLTTPKEG